MKGEHRWSDAKLVEVYARYDWFCGDTCSQCHKTANVLDKTPGWFCSCGAYNTLHWFGGNQHPHDHPDLGPSIERLNAAVQEVKRRDPWLRKFLGG